MSGVGSTNAMKKGSGNNPFLAYSKADMQGFLNSAYTGRIVKYAGSSTKTGVPRGNNLNLGDAQNLVVDLTKSFTYNQGLSKSRKWYITIESETGNKCIMDITINKQTGEIGTPVLISDTIKALIYSIYTPYSSLIGRNINDLDVKFLSVTGTDVDRDVVTNWPTTSGWQKDCFNDSGKITLWGYGEKVTAIQNQNDMDYWSAYPILYTEPYVANVLYKVVYSNGQYYFEEYYHISENVTTATVEDVALGKTFYDFTGTKQTGTGTKINPYLATDLDMFKSFPAGSFIKWLGPDRTVLDETTGQMLIQNEIYRSAEDGDIFQYVILPTLSNPADPIDVAEGKEVINQLGAVMIGTGNNVLQASTTEGMQALFIDANIGKIAKYVGETDVYIKDAFYLITADSSAKQYYELPALTSEGTADDLALGKELINSKGDKITGTRPGKLNDTSWENIRKIILSGKAAYYWEVGDTKQITSKSGKTYKIRLCDLQEGRYDYSDGSGSSKAVFEFVECYNLNEVTTWTMNGHVSNIGGWAKCQMKASTMQKILADLPDDMVIAISEVNVLSGTGNGTNSGVSESVNKLFLPAETEIFSKAINSIGLEECSFGQFDYYKLNNTNTARIKYDVGTTSNSKYWWERSPMKNNTSQFCIVETNGTSSHYHSAASYSVSPIFAI